MKKIYWRPAKVPKLILVVIAGIAIAGMLSVEFLKTKKKLPYYSEKIQAALTMKKGMDLLRTYRLQFIGPIDKEVDPAGSGLIGLPSSAITTNFGYLPAKQTTINPNWAAVLVHMLKKAGVREGDVVAMGLSGSFPAMALAAFSAAEALKVEVIAVSSASASNWGANDPDFTWLDMETVLKRAGLIPGSAAASLGGEGDRALGMPQESKEALHRAIERNQLPMIGAASIEEGIETRMNFYQEQARGKPIAAYVNIGGSRLSVGPRTGKKLYAPGLNLNPTRAAVRIDSVTSRFARVDVPIIHISRIKDLAERYGLPVTPESIPMVGEGQIFTKPVYNLYLIFGNLLLLFAVSHLFLKLDIGYRIFVPRRMSENLKHPEPMV